MEDSEFDVIVFDKIERLREALSDWQVMKDTKALVFDLAKDDREAKQMKDFDILKDIQEKFNTLRIPIFIHSAFANMVDEFSNCGTVWKIEKSGTSLENIVTIITALNDSGFLDAFCPGGLIEQSLMEQLHKSFTEQFRGGEIEAIINSIKRSNPKDYTTRTINILRRISLRAFTSEMLALIVANDDALNPIEHFYRRISSVSIWTGDIWTEKETSENVIVLTPRCDLALDKATNIMLCSISSLDIKLTGSKEEKLKRLQNHLTDNLPGKSTRYLPSSPMFKGGMVELSSHKTIEKKKFLESHVYCITLSDDLANEIIGKFVYYFLRTGITTINPLEFEAYLDLLKGKD
jgi:hypothetical protein